MYKALLFLPVLFLSATLQAQNIPNGGFEQWTDVGDFLNPTGWRTSNWASWSVDGSLTCEQGSPGAVGDHFVMVTDRYLDGMGMQQASITIAAEGVLFPGFPFTERPEALNGMYQYHPIGIGHDGVVGAALTRWNPVTLQREVIANAPLHAPGPVTEWQAFSIPFLYYSDLDPDTAMVSVQASNNASEDGTSIWVDELSFGSAQGVTELAAEQVQLWPSPASDALHVSANGALAQVIVRDMSGRVMVRCDVHQTVATVPVTGLPAGMYLAELRLADGKRAVQPFAKD